MSSTTARRPFHWAPFRAVPALLAAFVMQYNILHHVDRSQWWLPFGAALFALITIVITGAYDDELEGGLFGPLTSNNVSWLMVTLGLPATALVCGIIQGSGWWSAGAAIVLVANAALCSSFRQQGLPGLIVVICFLALAIG